MLAWTAATVLPLLFLAIFFVWPVLALVVRGFFPHGQPSLAGFEQVFSSARTWRIIRTTLSLAVLGTVASVLLGVPGAYVLYRTRFPGRGIVRAFVTIPFVLPTVVVGVAFRTLLGSTGPLGFLRLEETLTAIVAALVFFNYSVIVRTVGGLWGRLDPRMGEAARVLGATPARVFCTVTLPALAPAIASGAAIVFLFCASAYGIVMVMGGVRWATIETEIWYQTTQLLNLPAASVLSVTQLLVVTLSLWVANRMQARQQVARRLTTDDTGERSWSWRRDAPASILTAAVVLGLLLTPLVYLAYRSVATPTGIGLDYYRALATTGDGALAMPVWASAAQSLRIALAATVLSVTLGLLVSFVLSRRPRSRLGRAALRGLDSFFMLPLGVSAVTVGFGFLVTLNRPPLDLRSSAALVPIAQAIVALPLVVRSLLPVLRAIDPRQREAAAALGASPWRVLGTIDVPLALRGLGLATGFALATSLGEFGATSFLARPDQATLPVVISELIGRPGASNYGMAMAASVLLALMTGTAMALAERFRPRAATGW